MCVTSILFASCLKDDCETVALPTKLGVIPESVIPAEMQDRLAQQMNLYTGTNPPNVEGRYLVSPVQPLYASDGFVDDRFYDMLLNVEEQSERSIARYSEGQHSAEVHTRSARIIGESPNFTLYDQVLVTDDDENFSYHAIIVISGSYASGGIKDLQYAFIMGSHEYGGWQLAPEGTWRVFCDGDAYSPKQ